ncbi:hypothetical protein [Streptomyces sp. NPDC017435]|uniref:hypothetical protein n=1 Tax=Streptomyces sp. NPDC017435 TaxID=3364995 RepID=UPI00379DF5E6
MMPSAAFATAVCTGVGTLEKVYGPPNIRTNAGSLQIPGTFDQGGMEMARGITLGVRS